MSPWYEIRTCRFANCAWLSGFSKETRKYPPFILLAISSSISIMVAVRHSPVASYTEGPQRFVVEYSYEATGEWRTATIIDIEDEIANSINGGYFLVSLEKPLNQAQLANLQVRISYQGDISDLDRAYIESLWLEVTSASFYEETDPEYLSGAIDYS